MLAKTWESYKMNVLTINYPNNFNIDKALGFQDLSVKFDDIRNLKISRTIHNVDIELFHIMIDLST